MYITGGNEETVLMHPGHPATEHDCVENRPHIRANRLILSELEGDCETMHVDSIHSVCSNSTSVNVGTWQFHKVGLFK